MKHVVALSGGKDSTAMALRLREVCPRVYTYLITPVGNELPEMFAHWRHLERLLGTELTVLKPFDGDGGPRILQRASVGSGQQGDHTLTDELDEDPLGCDAIMFDRPADWNNKEHSAETNAEISRRAKLREAGRKLPLYRKVDYAVRVIRRAFKNADRWGVAFSGGADSHVLSHLVCTEVAGACAPPHFMYNTRLEYRETMRNVYRWREWLAKRGVQLHIEYPDMTPPEVWAKYGYPVITKEAAHYIDQAQRNGHSNGLQYISARVRPHADSVIASGVRVSGMCCDKLKKEPGDRAIKRLNLNGVFIGTRAEESGFRKLTYVQRGSLYFAVRYGYWIANPLTHWNRADVDAYLANAKITIERPNNTLGRSGCRCCGFGCLIDQMKGRENSLQSLARDEPAFHKAVMQKWGMQAACDAAGIDTEPKDHQQ